jgi:hypothetical protein
MLCNGCYVKVWDVINKTNSRGNEVKQLRVSNSRKNEDGSYTQEFNGFITLRGDAAKKTVNQSDSVRLMKIGVMNNYDKTTNTTYTNFLCFDLLTPDEIEKGKAARGQVDIDSQPPMPTTPGNPPASAPETKENPQTPVTNESDDDFMTIPDGIADEELPFA